MEHKYLRFYDEGLEFCFVQPDEKWSHSADMADIRGNETGESIMNRIRYYVDNSESVRDLIANCLDNGHVCFVIEDAKEQTDYIMDCKKYWFEGKYIIELKLRTVWFWYSKMIRTKYGYKSINIKCRKGQEQPVLHIGRTCPFIYTLKGGFENAVYPETAENFECGSYCLV